MESPLLFLDFSTSLSSLGVVCICTSLQSVMKPKYLWVVSEARSELPVAPITQDKWKAVFSVMMERAIPAYDSSFSLVPQVCHMQKTSLYWCFRKDCPETAKDSSQMQNLMIKWHPVLTKQCALTTSPGAYITEIKCRRWELRDKAVALNWL